MFKNTTIKYLSGLGVIYLAIQLALRLFLFLSSAQDISWTALDILRTLSLGFVYDLVVELCLLLPLCCLLSLVPDKFLQKKFGKKLITFFTFSFFLTVSMTTICELFFWQEFRTRFNFIAVDYLVYTHEVLENIWQSYHVVPLILSVIIFSFGATRFFLKKFSLRQEVNSYLSKLKNLAVFVIALVSGLSFMNASFTGHVSTNNYNREVAANGIFHLFHAFFNNELDYERFYIHQDNSKVLANLQQKLTLDGSVLNNTSDSSRKYESASNANNTKPNIVVIAVESLSARFTGFANKENSLTPYLDKLANEAFTYNRVYATGTRSVRGLEAVSLCLPPTPGQSIIRRPNNKDLFNTGTPLEKLGYSRQFVYGGYGYFDNMNAFFANNDFEIFDRTNIPKNEVYFETVWGVADEILFSQIIGQLDKKTVDGPVMQIILTTTNHRPFTFPENSIDAPQGKRESVIKYTDWAIQNFIENARKKPWFDNTVFVILADHNANVAGRTSLPISNYHIPCIIYAPKLIPQGHSDRLMSQIDIMPTVFGMLGMSYETKSLGYDINKLAEGKERTFISTFQQLGYVANDTLVVFEPNNKVSAYKINDYATDSYTKITPTKEMLDDALAWYQGANYLYKKDLLKIAPSK